MPEADRDGTALLQKTRTHAPERWEFVGTFEYAEAGGERYQNECGLWLVIEGTTVVTWVGNFHVAVVGTKTEIGQYETPEASREVAIEWMEEHPDPWDDQTEGGDE